MDKVRNGSHSTVLKPHKLRRSALYILTILD